MRIVETSNQKTNSPEERFVNLPPMSFFCATSIVELINSHLSGSTASRKWKVEPSSYKLQQVGKTNDC